MTLTTEEKLAAVERYEENNESAAEISKDIGVCIATLRRWVRDHRAGREICSWGGTRTHYHGFEEEDIRWFVYFKNKGWKMRDIAEKIERSLNTTYAIQVEARKRGLINSDKARQRGDKS